MNNDVETKHPSFGTVSIVRTSSHPPQSLFDSKTQHSHYVSLRISDAIRVRNSDTHSTMVMPKETIISVDMSESQFAHMIASINMGAGTPCTISRRDGELIEDCPADTTSKEYGKEAITSCNNAIDRMDEAQEFIDGLAKKKSPMNKAERKQLSEIFDSVRQQIKQNIPFVLESLQETMDVVVEGAKTEIETHFMKAAQATGMNAIEAKNPVALIGTSEDPKES